MNDKKQLYKALSVVAIILLVIATLFAIAIFLLLLVIDTEKVENKYKAPQQEIINNESCPRYELLEYGFATNTCKLNIDPNKILPGGPSKDGIPTINNPKFIPYSQSKISDTTRGILINIGNQQKFYPYNILAYHEIVNDNINDTYYSVTFCPLCDSGIVFNRKVNTEILQFGVSGLLYESNLLMYDTSTDSLWSQAKRTAVVGDYAGTELEILPFQLLSFIEAKIKYPRGVVLSEDTGFIRNYNTTPYSGYLENEGLYFPVSINDQRFTSKELMYVIPFENISITFPYRQLETGIKNFDIGDNEITIQKMGGEIYTTINNKKYPGYFELWFSWATHHQDDGVVLQI